MSDSGLGGPGTHVLYQDFVASAVGATLSFELFIGNRANDFYPLPPWISPPRPSTSRPASTSSRPVPMPSAWIQATS
jgi:hypothetical protein